MSEQAATGVANLWKVEQRIAQAQLSLNTSYEIFCIASVAEHLETHECHIAMAEAAHEDIYTFRDTFGDILDKYIKRVQLPLGYRVVGMRSGTEDKEVWSIVNLTEAGYL